MINISEFHSCFLFRDQADSINNKISMNACGISEGPDYCTFLSGIVAIEKRLRELMEEVRVNPLTVTGASQSELVVVVVMLNLLLRMWTRLLSIES